MRARRPFAVPLTLALGLGVIAAAEILLAVDVAARGGALAPGAVPAPPDGLLGALGRAAAVHMTPVAWVGYLLLLDGVLAWRRGAAGSPARARPGRFALCCLASVPIWLWFDFVNFGFVHAWDYHGLPASLPHRWLMYFVAFATICPAMFLTAELIQRLGTARLAGAPLRVGPAGRRAMLAAGAVFLAFPFMVGDATGTLTMWLAWILLLDPLNARLGAPSLLGDWGAGRYGRTVALLAAGLVCGFLWEFWNFWAVAKWTYALPFLGPLETVRLFEMPLVGFLGFPPFAVECWVMFQTVAWAVSRLRPGLAEPLPERASVI